MTFNLKKFKHLQQFHSTYPPYLSLFIPTSRAGGVQEDKIRFKNALQEAAERIASAQSFSNWPKDKGEAKKYLKPAYQLLEKEDFWLHQSDGLALFISQDYFEYFNVPIEFTSYVHVGTEFYLRPMFPLLSGEKRFFLLALSKGDVRFFEGDTHHIYAVRIDDLVPTAMELVPSIGGESSLQFHTGANGNAVFHGKGAGKDQELIDTQKYIRRIDKGLMNMLHDERVPLVLAAVDYLVPIYKEITQYPHIIDSHISGNPEELHPVVLHEKAWNLLEDHFIQDIEAEKNTYIEAKREGKSSHALDKIIPAAQDGRIETLFIATDVPPIWGTYEVAEKREIHFHESQHAHNTCLLNFAAMKTWKNGGTVYALPQSHLPDHHATLNATFRF